MALGRCLLPKESSGIDETTENRVVWRMAIFMLIEPERAPKTAMRRMTRFSMVSSIQDDSLGSKHLPGDI
jgi:hypothetical protein